MHPPFPLIIGPTAGGKTGLSLALAAGIASTGTAAEVITADALQVYRGLDIATAKPSPAERAGVPHHLLDIREPDATYTVHEWLRDAESTIQAIRGRGGMPIVVGGTHLYAKALLEGLFEGPEPDPALRRLLESTDRETLRDELARIDPEAASRIHPNDIRRTIRAVEVFRQTGTPISDLQQQWDEAASPRTDALLVGLDWPTEALNTRINARVKSMMAAGLLAETTALWQAGSLGPQAREALGTKQLIDHLEGRSTLEDAVEHIKIQTRRFAKNQRTWLRRLRATPNALWLPGPETADDPASAAERIIRAAEATADREKFSTE
ncbi:MAG: tRNA (adenosine(37)-N6)-dimethylallyltransferase MiaA [Planctomycetota bacterium]